MHNRQTSHALCQFPRSLIECTHSSDIHAAAKHRKKKNCIKRTENKKENEKQKRRREAEDGGTDKEDSIKVKMNPQNEN